jgi:choline dehydrogenase-like flavoprotein
VEPSGALGLRIRYRPDESDRAEFSRGMVACARLLFAAGARRVLVPAGRAIAIERPGDATTLGDVAAPELSAVHPMGSVPMGADARVAAVGTDGRHHHVAGLWVADGSLFPSSIGVPPQLSIYAMGLRVGEAIVAAGG